MVLFDSPPFSRTGSLPDFAPTRTADSAAQAVLERTDQLVGSDTVPWRLWGGATDLAAGGGVGTAALCGLVDEPIWLCHKAPFVGAVATQKRWGGWRSARGSAGACTRGRWGLITGARTLWEAVCRSCCQRCCRDCTGIPGGGEVEPLALCAAQKRPCEARRAKGPGSPGRWLRTMRTGTLKEAKPWQDPRLEWIRALRFWVAVRWDHGTNARAWDRATSVLLNGWLAGQRAAAVCWDGTYRGLWGTLGHVLCRGQAEGGPGRAGPQAASLNPYRPG